MAILTRRKNDGTGHVFVDGPAERRGCMRGCMRGWPGRSREKTWVCWRYHRGQPVWRYAATLDDALRFVAKRSLTTSERGNRG